MPYLYISLEGPGIITHIKHLNYAFPSSFFQTVVSILAALLFKS
jgi:hypothetical protein